MSENKKKELIGTVLKSKMDKTVVVRVSRRFPHPKYKKFITRSKKYYAHDSQNICSEGDVIRIVESKPISKLKTWCVLKVEKESVK